jgi:hypothetical protein
MLRLVAVNRFRRSSRKQLNVPIRWLVALGLPQQLRQPCDVDRDAPRLVEGEHLRLPRFGFVSREAGWVGHGADCVAAELVARQRSDGWTPVASVRYGFRDDLGRKFDVSRRFRSARGDSDRLH